MDQWVVALVGILAVCAGAAFDARPAKRPPVPTHDERDEWTAHLDVLHDSHRYSERWHR